MRRRTNRALLLSFVLHIGLMLAISPFLVNHFNAEKESISAEILEVDSEKRVKRQVLPPRPRLMARAANAETSSDSPASRTYAPRFSAPKALVHADVVPDVVTHTDIPQTDNPSAVSNAGFGEDRTLSGPVVIEGQQGIGAGGIGRGGSGTGTGGNRGGSDGIGEHFSNFTGTSDISSTAFDKIAYAFTFVRLKYAGMGSSWKIDWPDSDHNFIQQLQARTSLDVAPEGKIIDIDSEELFRYPFAYIIEANRLNLTRVEAKNLRNYLLSGGFIFVDDFHGQHQWNQFYAQFKRIFPEREPEDIPMSHPLFHCFYHIDELMQIPGSGAARRGITYEGHDGYPAQCRGVYDDSGRLMMMINFNTDLGDGWEHATDDFYPDKYSDMAFKMGVNAVVYALSFNRPVYQSKPKIPDALKKLQQRLEQIEEIE
ncbi:MAG: DUF4159 domain-containing protein [Candidatus Poribacteria bacterium]|nr:DUF4159 domain-containing protein [Candidatus Poribacteria bacterium]